jgi:hypothetical protein
VELAELELLVVTLEIKALQIQTVATLVTLDQVDQAVTVA